MCNLGPATRGKLIPSDTSAKFQCRKKDGISVTNGNSRPALCGCSIHAPTPNKVTVVHNTEKKHDEVRGVTRLTTVSPHSGPPRDPCWPRTHEVPQTRRLRRGRQWAREGTLNLHAYVNACHLTMRPGREFTSQAGLEGRRLKRRQPSTRRGKRGWAESRATWITGGTRTLVTGLYCFCIPLATKMFFVLKPGFI